MMKFRNFLILLALFLGVGALFLEQAEQLAFRMRVVTNVLDFLILGITLTEAVLDLVSSPYKKRYIRRNLLSLSFLAVYLVLFSFTKWTLFSHGEAGASQAYSTIFIVIRNIFLLLKVATRLKKFASIVESLTIHPSQSILLSFFMVILVGALLLMLPIATPDGEGLHIIDAWFTATSAVCVTGLIVVDTGAAFTGFGKVVILLLIQIGGLGIMLLTFFAIFALRKSVSLQNKFLISYMLSEEDMSQLSRTVKGIVRTTFIVEGAGAFLLFAGFLRHEPFSAGLVFSAVFHSISAFCNAGFSLFSTSLESYVSDPVISGTIALLIILGGLSFSVIANLTGRARGRQRKLSFNTQIVLIATAVLIGSGTLLFYGLEHGGVLREYGTGTQYLAAFFQSVTLRTAGFNSVPFGGLRDATVLVMMVFMFIGAAAGSTAGGIKVNTVGVIAAYFMSLLRGRDSTVVLKHGISRDQVVRAFTVLLFGLVVITTGVTILAVSEEAPLRDILFEAVSAFGTVGLSLGITASLSGVGKMVIMLLMFAGRLGPLTVLTAAAGSEQKVRIEYPQGDILLG